MPLDLNDWKLAELIDDARIRREHASSPGDLERRDRSPSYGVFLVCLYAVLPRAVALFGLMVFERRARVDTV